MICFRADGNDKIGNGHLSRCLSIAGAFKSRGVECSFVTSAESPIGQIEAAGYPCYCLNSNYQEKENELPLFEAYIKKQEVEYIFVDSYEVTAQYLKSLKALAKLIYIDDLNLFFYPCDLLLNYAIYAKSEMYSTGYEKAKKLIGCKYVPLGEQYRELLPRQIKQKAENILLLTGATDFYGISMQFTEWMKSHPDSGWTIRIICGKYNAYKQKLIDFAKNREDIEIICNSSNLLPHMQWADIAVSAGGVTLYELCAAGIPALSYALVDNQLDNCRTFREKDIIEYMGDIRKGLDIDSICDRVGTLAGDYQLRKARSLRMQELVDGKGTQRIVDAVFE